MLIKYGCELSIEVNNPTSTFCMVDIHPERRADVITETGLTLRPLTDVSDELDVFGNRLRRFVAPAGETSLRLAGVIKDSGVPDTRAASAELSSPTAIPPNVAMYLNGSRYCETDKMGDVAWNTFGDRPRDAGLRAIGLRFCAQPNSLRLQARAFNADCIRVLRRAGRSVP